MKKLILLTTVILSTQLIAQNELKTESISIFKNGKSFVVKQGNVKALDDNTYTLNKIPNALFGTLWFLGKESKVVQVTSMLEQVNEPIERKASSFTDLLYANKGKAVTIVTSDDKVYSGTVEDYDLPEEVNTFMQLRETEIKAKYNNLYNTDFQLFPTASPVLLLKMNSKWVSIAPSSIKSIEFNSRPERTTKFNISVKKPLVKVKFDKGGNQTLNMMYLQNDISWTPTYLLELASDTEAKLRLQAEVANDAEDITNTDVNFVVGVPNFKYADNSAILTTLGNIVMRNDGYAARLSGAGRFSNAISSQAMGFAREVEIDDTPINVEAESSGEYYFYNIKNVTLEKGARAYYPIFNVPVKIKQLYECNLSGVQDERNYRNDDDEISLASKSANVSHSIEIINSTSHPFTTGSVMIVEAGSQRPLSEDLIKYTGVGQKSTIYMTQSPDISVKEQEKVVSKKEEAKRQNGYTYNLLTVQSEITITNTKKQDINMAIYKIIAGKCNSANVKYDGKQVPNPNSSNINSLENLTFNIEVIAGQKQVITYTYQMYIRYY